MKTPWLVCTLCCAAGNLIAGGQDVAVRAKGGEDVSGPYEVVPNWPRPISKELTWGRTANVFAESPDRVFVIQSGMVPRSWRQLDGDLRVGAERGGKGW